MMHAFDARIDTGRGSARGWIRDLVTILDACLAAGTAAWLVPASVQIVSWSRAGAGRVALFAPGYALRWSLGAAALASAALWLLGPRSDATRRRRAHAIAPLAALWVWAIPFVPWLPDRWPLLLVFEGPLRWVVLAAAVAACIARVSGSYGSQLPNVPVPGRRTVFVCSLVFYLLIGFRSLGVAGLGGDEPHYLVITHSLLVDHDLKIENNHARGDYRAFFGGPLKPDYLRRGLNEEIYSIHAPGLPALLLPAYALAGVQGAVAMMCLFAALAALAVFDLAGLVGGTRAAWATWAGTCLTIPFVPHAWAIYPEMAGAAIVAWALVWCAESKTGTSWQWLWRGACLAMLPWLHTKFVVFLPSLTLLLVFSSWRQWRHHGALLAPVALSSIAWLTFFYVVYGTVDPQAPYGGSVAQFVKLENIPRSLAGSFFDPKFGMIVYAPIYVGVLIGLPILLRQRRWTAFGASAIMVAMLYVLTSARYYMWWGGSSAPARFLVPVVPLLAPMLAALFARVRWGLLAAHMWALLLVSLGVSALGITAPSQFVLFSSPHGVARILEWLQGGSPLAAAVPTFTEEQWLEPLGRLTLWIGSALAAAAIVLVIRRRRPAGRTGLFWPMFSEGVMFAAIASLVAGPFSPPVRALTVQQGRLAMMRAFDPFRLRAFDYRRGQLAKMTTDEWLATSGLTFELDPADAPDPQGRLTEGLALPAGEYRVAASFQDRSPRTGDLMMALGGGHVLARTAGPLISPTRLQFATPIEIPQLWVQVSDPASARGAVRVEIEPLSIVPASQRLHIDAGAVESIPGRQNAYMVYVDEGTFPEGGVFWTRGTSRGEVLVAPAGASTVVLTLHLGPVGGTVRLEVGGRKLDVMMSADETRTVTVDVPVGSSYVSIAVQAPGAFRPADVDPKSTDARSLGCQVRVALDGAGS